MLIKSQDGTAIVNTNTLISLNVYKGNIYCDTTYNDEDYKFIMASYETDDEAKAALNKLFEAIDEPKYDLGGVRK